MSLQLIQQYYAKVEKLIRYGGARNEKQLRKPFESLLDQYAHSKNLLVVPEVEFITNKGHKVYPDGTLKDALRQDWGYWESKDEKDDLRAEIAAKFAKGYPSYNILFEDAQTAVLFQNGNEVTQVDFNNPNALDEILTLFVSYERPEVREFHKAIENFTEDVPELARTLRDIIEEQYTKNEKFKLALNEFLTLCQKAINPKVEMADVREMIIQHVLTEDIFMRIFDEAEFHRENIIARKLQEVVSSFYFGASKHNIENRISPYYETINARAAQIYDHHEKQKFLKVLYENFYKSYNPKAADRLGVIYTPDEIVRFMIEGTDHLLEKHFDKTIGDQYVEILDPAVGTGTFITELIEYLPNNQVDQKYENEIHCNEVAILPYYIANLNIEFTYKQKIGKYKEFENICFMDTLDNMSFSRSDTHQMDFFGLWDENIERIGRQNTRKISVVIGNPPYNAKQQNYNYQNSNRPYPYVDERIKNTYIKDGTAQNQIVVYDMYTRFIRWASDRLDRNGIIVFVSNNSFLEGKAFDGFRKTIVKEFNEIYIVNMKGNAHSSGGERKKQGGNVFNDQIRVGITIYFFLRKAGENGCHIHYNEVPDFTTAVEKLSYLRDNKFVELKFDHIIPDKKFNWINKTEDDFGELMPLVDKDVKAGLNNRAIFSLFSRGIASLRDEWIYDFSKDELTKKMQYFTRIYQNTTKDDLFPEKMTIKWDRELNSYLLRKIEKNFSKEQIVKSLYKPFVKMDFYFDRHFNGMTYQWFNIYRPGKNNITLAFNVGSTEFVTIVSDEIICQGTLLVGGGSTQCAPLYRFNSEGQQIENVTDWSLGQFQKHYKDKKITKLNIFHYVYAVLNFPAYRSKYYQTLKRDFPHIPYYNDFWQWADWGEKLTEMHLTFDQAIPYPLKREDLNPETIHKTLGPRLIARKENGSIEIDAQTILRGVPGVAWEYQLGTYSALEWILERYKEKTPKDPTIREKFNTYKFADYKEKVIDLIQRVCTVSVETMKIIKQMPDT